MQISTCEGGDEMVSKAVITCADALVQIFWDLIGCPINTTSHIEGWHSTLKVYYAALHPAWQKYLCDTHDVKDSRRLARALSLSRGANVSVSDLPDGQVPPDKS